MAEKFLKLEMKPIGIKMESDVNEFALALHTWRLRQGLTQKQVGDKWGVSRYTIMRAEAATKLTWQMAYKLFAKLAQELKEEGEQ